MKLNIFSSVVLMAWLLGACSDLDIKPDDPFSEGDHKTVYLRFNTSRQETREVEATATGTAAPLLSAILYFMDSAADPLVYAVRTVGGTGADATVAQIEAGYEFTGIPSLVTQVYVVGNYNSADQDLTDAAFPIYDGTTFSVIQDVVLNIQQVAYPVLADGTTSSVLLSVMDGQADLAEYGVGTNTWTGSNTPAAGDLYANVTLAPVNARIEIEEISYAGDLLASFTLEGIYINNYYPELPVSLTPGTNEPVNNGSDVTLYDRNNSAYAYSYYTTLEDEVDLDATVAGGTAAITPGMDLVWAYHVFGNSDLVPHVILKLTNVVTQDGTELGTRYVTVSGFMNASTGAEITVFARNTIYKITDLAFTDGDISIVPEPEEIGIWIHVEVEDWTTVYVNPVI
ncbi:MAG: hypothetical protein LUG96_06070 [Tannerellaceae bacterium]|nr:hypothetical protein [Tannerellaceae bacterium]